MRKMCGKDYEKILVLSKEKILDTPEIVTFKQQKKNQETKDDFWNSIDKELQAVAEILGKNN